VVQTFRLAQQAVPAPPGPQAPAAAAAPPATVIWGQVPYNPVTDDPASPGYIAPGKPGAQHPVPAELAKRLNERAAGANAPWTLSWLPNPNGPALPPGFRGERLTPQQRAELDRKVAEIGPAIDKAIKDAHIEDTVRKALSAQDAKTREEVLRQLQDLGPRIQRQVAGAQFGFRIAELPPQIAETMREQMRQAEERQAQAEDQVAAQLEAQAKQARERAQRARDQLKQSETSSPALDPAPKN